MGSIIRDKSIKRDEGMLHHVQGVDLILSNIEVSGMEILLVNAMSRETTLKAYLEPLKKSYDYVLIDCMDSNLEEAGKTADRTWVFRTDQERKIKFTKEYLLSGG